MPLHQLAVSPADVSGAGLGLALNAPAPPPLATCRLDHPRGGTLVLGVLGASHVITVEHAKGSFSEQVSCHLGGELPEHTDAPGYRLESRTDRHDEPAFRRLAQRLRERCARETGWLGGTFPGGAAAPPVPPAEPAAAGGRWQPGPLSPAASGGPVVYTASRWHP